MTPTGKGNYKECFECKHQMTRLGLKYPCIYSHRYIRNNSNGVGIKYERDFKFCGVKETKGNQNGKEK